MSRDFFPILRIHRADLRAVGLDASEVTDEEMEQLASSIGEYLAQSGLIWKALRHYARRLNLPFCKPTEEVK